MPNNLLDMIAQDEEYLRQREAKGVLSPSERLDIASLNLHEEALGENPRHVFEEQPWWRITNPPRGTIATYSSGLNRVPYETEWGNSYYYEHVPLGDPNPQYGGRTPRQAPINGQTAWNRDINRQTERLIRNTEGWDGQGPFNSSPDEILPYVVAGTRFHEVTGHGMTQEYARDNNMTLLPWEAEQEGTHINHGLIYERHAQWYYERAERVKEENPELAQDLRRLGDFHRANAEDYRTTPEGSFAYNPAQYRKPGGSQYGNPEPRNVPTLGEFTQWQQEFVNSYFGD